jgi:hypothetical protein
VTIVSTLASPYNFREDVSTSLIYGISFATSTYMLVESFRGTQVRQHLLDMGVKKELLAGMTDDDLEVLLDGFRAILATSEKARVQRLA